MTFGIFQLLWKCGIKDQSIAFLLDGQMLFLNDVGLFKKQKQEQKFWKILYEHELKDVLSLKDNRATFWS